MINWEAEIIPNFTLKEARCHGKEGEVWHDCDLVILTWSLSYFLYSVRKEFGKPIIVRSWTRCKSHNLAVGGKKDSYHQNGRAIDITCKNKLLDELEMIARRKFPFVKRHKTFIHCDIRGERP